jgi:ribosome-associated translation inhibitor RaiA
MNLDIETERVIMRSEWHRMIDDWVARCRKVHPDVLALDIALRHVEAPHPSNRVDAVARGRGRTLRAGAEGEKMATVLHQALDALDRKLEIGGRPSDRAKAA